MKAICVWYDCYGDPDDNGWVVSLDDLDDQMRAETTETIWSTPDEDEAVERALHEGERRELPVYRNTAGKPAELLQAVAE